MTVWLIEPRDPLIFRDGRPFGAMPGISANSLQFPFPSTIAGAVRANAGLDSNGVFQFNPKNYPLSQSKAIQQKLDQLMQLAIRGPLLVQLPKKGRDITSADWMVPAPKDAVIVLPESEELVEGQKEGFEYRQVKQMLPSAVSSEEHFDLQQKLQSLSLVKLQQGDAGKPDGQTPRYWTWESMLSWLLNPQQFQEHPQALQKLGHSGPGREIRTHIHMNAYTRAGQEGMLFNTSGLEFIYNDTRASIHLGTAQDLGLAVMVDDGDEKKAEIPTEFELRPGPGCLGGERRIVNWRRSACKVLECPNKLVEDIMKNEACRLILLTPAYFTEGFMPSWITGPREKVQLQPELKAIAIDRPQVVSGWDLASGRPKLTRRLAPAGTVLFLSFKDSLKWVSDPKQAIIEWISATWMRCISDVPQDRTDGFGLAVLGIWSDNTPE